MKPPRSDNPHTQLVRTVLDYIELQHDVTAWKTQSGTIPTANRDGGVRYVSTGTKGLADISGIVDAEPWGIPVFFEVKTGTGKLTLDQRCFRDRVTDMGAAYFEVRSLRDVRAAIAKCRNLARARSHPSIRNDPGNDVAIRENTDAEIVSISSAVRDRKMTET